MEDDMEKKTLNANTLKATFEAAIENAGTLEAESEALHLKANLPGKELLGGPFPQAALDLGGGFCGVWSKYGDTVKKLATFARFVPGYGTATSAVLTGLCAIADQIAGVVCATDAGEADAAAAAKAKQVEKDQKPSRTSRPNG
jgi:hypothetical protein